MSAAAVTPAANPVIPQSCGLDATLVLDASGSISSSSAVEKVRSAGNAFVKALKDTKSTTRITQFGTFSDQLAPRTVVDAAATSATGVLTKAMNKYYNPIPAKPSDSSIYQYNGGTWTNPKNYTKTTASNANQWTNWDAGMDQARTETKAPEIIVFVTDGDPTVFNLNKSGDPNYGNGKNVAVNTGSGDAANPTLDRAIQQANAAKVANTRIMVVGVGPAVTKPGSDSVKRMEKMSGPQVVQDKDLGSITSINQIDGAGQGLRQPRQFPAAGRQRSLRSVADHPQARPDRRQQRLRALRGLEHDGQAHCQRRFQLGAPGHHARRAEVGSHRCQRVRAVPMGAEGPQHHLRCAGHRRSEGRLHLRATGYEQRLDL